MRPTILFTALALVLAALAATGAAALMVERIEQNSQREVRAQLMSEQIDWAEVAVDGLRVTLSGSAPDEATRFRALTLAGNVVDATRVIDAMHVDPPKQVQPPDFSIEILRNDEGISMIGLVPLALDRPQMADRLQEIAGRAEVTDLLETADFPVPRGWDAALSFALEALARLPRSKISVAPDRVQVTAISDSGEQKRELEEGLRAETPAGLEVALDISAPRPVITPFTLRFLLDETGGRFDACAAHTEDGRARILAAAAEAGLQGSASCTLGLGVPSPRWPDAVTEGIRAVARLGGGTLSVTDADVTLVAPVGTAQNRFDRVVGELEAALPEVFSLHPVLPEPEPADGSGPASPAGTPEFSATLSPEGLLQLRGRVSDERLRTAVEGFARARFSTADVDAAMRVTDGLPMGWPGRVLAGLEALSLLSNGSLLVRPDTLSIRGDTGNPDAKAEIARILGEQLGDAGQFTIEVTYQETLDPVADLPTPQECVDAINAILAARQITFEPGSAEIDSAARDTVERIAEVMRDCTAVPMEIGGHTDSQGRESMNLGLSQRRAEAVLEALMARRVLTANLTAKGYGEETPIADNDTEAGREANRRIEFTLLTPEADAEEEGEAEADADADAPETEGEQDDDSQDDSSQDGDTE
jgi:OOP family OmpA-OmpF porin